MNEKANAIIARAKQFAGSKAAQYIAAGVVSIALTAVLVVTLLTGSGTVSHSSGGAAASCTIMERFDMFITNSLSNALDGILSIDKVYFLNDSDLVAPEPDQSAFGETDDPASLQWLLDDAAELLAGQDTLFSTETVLLENSKIHYYLDETIFTVTWKQVIDNVVYTISEVKIAHPTQFRRFLADGQYGSDKQYLTTEMASSVNAVVASAGDFYKYRQEGIIVYNGEVKRINSDQVDTCGINEEGELVFMYRGQFQNAEEAQQYVDENGIRFTLAFGPILVDNFERCEPADYVLGEVNQNYSRAALCQMGDLHYLFITVNGEGTHYNYPNIHTFAQRVWEFGCEKAYTIDGGQTATIVVNDQLINNVNYGSQRQISDIVYFATALPGQK